MLISNGFMDFCLKRNIYGELKRSHVKNGGDKDSSILITVTS